MLLNRNKILSNSKVIKVNIWVVFYCVVWKNFIWYFGLKLYSFVIIIIIYGMENLLCVR